MTHRGTFFGLVALLAICAIGCSNQGPMSPQTANTAGFDGSLSGEAKLPKVDVCHITGNGKYVLINISGSALPAHLAHGDSLPGEDGLDDSCVGEAPGGDFVTFTDIHLTSFGESVVIEWTVDGTGDPVTYYVEGFDAYGAMVWEPIWGTDVVSGTGQGTYSTMDVYFFDEYRVRAVDGNGNEVISPSVPGF
jgi:hypothetical protein